MYSMSFFALSSVWYNFQSFVMENHVYFIAYIVTAGAISFAVTYRMVKYFLNILISNNLLIGCTNRFRVQWKISAL
jgi:hypothetical protein